MQRIALAALTAALFVFPALPPAHATAAGSTELSSQVEVKIGRDREHRRWESRRRHRGACKTVTKVTWVHGRKIKTTRKICP